MTSSYFKPTGKRKARTDLKPLMASWSRWPVSTPASIRLQDGRQLPAAYKQFTSGYAVTAHVGQGDTADFVVAVPDGMRQDLAYVTLTRGREGLTVVTSDAIALQESIGVSGDRQSASELARRASAVTVPLGIHGDDHQIYQQFQQERPPQQLRPEMKQEMTHNVTHSGISY